MNLKFLYFFFLLPIVSESGYAAPKVPSKSNEGAPVNQVYSPVLDHTLTALEKMKDKALEKYGYDIMHIFRNQTPQYLVQKMRHGLEHGRSASLMEGVPPDYQHDADYVSKILQEYAGCSDHEWPTRKVNVCHKINNSRNGNKQKFMLNISIDPRNRSIYAHGNFDFFCSAYKLCGQDGTPTFHKATFIDRDGVEKETICMRVEKEVTIVAYSNKEPIRRSSRHRAADIEKKSD